VNAEIISWKEGRSLPGRDAEKTALKRVGCVGAYTMDRSRSVCVSNPSGPDVASFSASNNTRFRMIVSIWFAPFFLVDLATASGSQIKFARTLRASSRA
jgi:hypothetical protein